MPRYDAVLFDNDGVLVEPPDASTQLDAMRDAFRAVGVDDPADADVDELANEPAPDRLAALCDGYGVDPESFWAARERHDERSQIAAFRAGDRGPYDDVAAIERVQGPRGVVSNNHHSTIAFALEYFGLEHLFETVYGREMTVESIALKKPNTHYLDRALADLLADPPRDGESPRALYVGDSESDVVAANRAGLDAAFVRRAHNADLELSDGAEPTYEVRGLDEIATLLD